MSLALEQPRLAPVQSWGCPRARDNFGTLWPLPEKTTCSFRYRFSGKSRNSGVVPGNRDPKIRVKSVHCFQIETPSCQMRPILRICHEWVVGFESASPRRGVLRKRGFAAMISRKCALNPCEGDTVKVREWPSGFYIETHRERPSDEAMKRSQEFNDRLHRFIAFIVTEPLPSQHPVLRHPDQDPAVGVVSNVHPPPHRECLRGMGEGGGM